MNPIVQNQKIVQAGQYLTFMLGDEQYGVPIETVREINRVGEITPVPRTPDFLKGVMNLRGKIIPVIELRIKFGMAPIAFTRNTCIIVIDTLTSQFGMIVDAVSEVVHLQESQIQAPPDMGDSVALSFVRGMGKIDNHVIILVDVALALSANHLEAIQELNVVKHG